MADVGSLQAALDRLPTHGGTVYLPARISPGPAIEAGPGGGGHAITSNLIAGSEGEMVVVREAPACMVEGNSRR